MLRTRLLKGLLQDLANRISFSILTLIGRHVLDAALAVLSVVSVHKAINPGSHGEKTPETTHWIALVIFHGAEP
jgi:hypothetical protein